MSAFQNITKYQVRFGDFSGLLSFLNSGDYSKEARVWRNSSNNFKTMVWAISLDRFPYREGGYGYLRGKTFDEYPKFVRETLKEAIRELSVLTIHEFKKGAACEQVFGVGSQVAQPCLSH